MVQKAPCQGKCHLCAYADNVLAGFEHKADAKRFLADTGRTFRAAERARACVVAEIQVGTMETIMAKRLAALATSYMAIVCAV